VAERVERVYDNIFDAPSMTILGRIKNSLSLGLISGIISAIFMILELIMLIFWSWVDPQETIEKSVQFDHAKYMNAKETFGDHTFKVAQSKGAEVKYTLYTN
jgi:hypothetical protein